MAVAAIRIATAAMASALRTDMTSSSRCRGGPERADMVTPTTVISCTEIECLARMTHRDEIVAVVRLRGTYELGSAEAACQASRPASARGPDVHPQPEVPVPARRGARDSDPAMQPRLCLLQRIRRSLEAGPDDRCVPAY